MPLSQSVVSLEYVRIPVSVIIAGLPYDPTGDDVKMAFLAPGVDPAGGDWKDAVWETVDGVHYILCLVGPTGTIALAKATYNVWVQIADVPEIPVRMVDTLTIT